LTPDELLKENKDMGMKTEIDDPLDRKAKS
jgi:hypothetical protein